MTEAEAWREVAEHISVEVYPRPAISLVCWPVAPLLEERMRQAWTDAVLDRDLSLPSTPLSEQIYALWLALEAEEAGR